jgi:hypothetical protein
MTNDLSTIINVFCAAANVSIENTKVLDRAAIFPQKGTGV